MQFTQEEKEIIQDHYRNPRNKTNLGQDEAGAVLDNPSCGDRVALKLSLDDEGKINAVLFDGEGCSLSMASASILTELLQGKSLDEARSLSRNIRSILKNEESYGNLEQYGEIKAFAPLIQSPVRLKCVTLAWDTLDKYLDSP